VFAINEHLSYQILSGMHTGESYSFW